MSQSRQVGNTSQSSSHRLYTVYIPSPPLRRNIQNKISSKIKEIAGEERYSAIIASNVTLLKVQTKDLPLTSVARSVPGSEGHFPTQSVRRMLMSWNQHTALRLNDWLDHEYSNHMRYSSMLCNTRKTENVPAEFQCHWWKLQDVPCFKQTESSANHILLKCRKSSLRINDTRASFVTYNNAG